MSPTKLHCQPLNPITAATFISFSRMHQWRGGRCCEGLAFRAITPHLFQRLISRRAKEEGENEPVGRQEAEEGEERAEGGNGGSQRMCNARLTHCHHDNRHHFTGAALRMPVWAEVT